MKIITVKCLREIFWRGRSCPAGSEIDVPYEDAMLLLDAGVVTYNNDAVEAARVIPPENAARRVRRP